MFVHKMIKIKAEGYLEAHRRNFAANACRRAPPVLRGPSQHKGRQISLQQVSSYRNLESDEPGATDGLREDKKLSVRMLIAAKVFEIYENGSLRINSAEHDKRLDSSSKSAALDLCAAYRVTSLLHADHSYEPSPFPMTIYVTSRVHLGLLSSAMRSAATFMVCGDRFGRLSVPHSRAVSLRPTRLGLHC
jgi:hypothetical protein